MGESTWPEVVIASWQQFVDEVCKAFEGSPKDYVFRGQEDSGWTLRPSIVRIAKRRGLSLDQVVKLEVDATKFFGACAAEYINPQVIRMYPSPSFPALWTVMQHHGAATRLLDWSGSPYAAAYFACRDLFKSDGAIWMVQQTRLVKAAESAGWAIPEEKDTPALDRWIYGSTNGSGVTFIWNTRRFSRAAIQQSLFSIATNPTVDHDGPVAALVPADDGGATLRRKFIIPYRLKESFVRHLHSMNVAASSLFPGIDGLGRAVSDAMNSDTVLR